MRRPPIKILYLLGAIGLAFYLFDLAYPGHFVGDMYGYEVIFRILQVASVIVLGLFGVMLLSFYWRNKSKTRLRFAGHLVIAVAAVLMIVMAVGSGVSRYHDNRREAFYKKDIAELIQIARVHKNPFAIDVIMAKGDTSAVEFLGGILLDRNEAMSLRYRSVQGLAYFGTARSRDILAHARESLEDEYLIKMIDQALETIDQSAGNVVPDRTLSDSE